MSGIAQAWLFDLDGTLADTAPDLGHAANQVRAECGLRPLPLADYRSVASSGARGLLGVALGMTPEHPDYAPHRDSFLAHYRSQLALHTRLFPGIAEFLLALELKHLRWGVVTNKAAWLTHPLMEALGLGTRAACIISGDSTPNPKPAPDSLFLACSQLHLKPADCVYVGDDLRDIDAARAAGMPSIAAGWGYIGDTRIQDWPANHVVASVADLRTLLDA